MAPSGYSAKRDGISNTSSRNYLDSETNYFDLSFSEALHVPPNLTLSCACPSDNQPCVASPKPPFRTIKLQGPRHYVHWLTDLIRDRRLIRSAALRTHLVIEQKNVATSPEDSEDDCALLTPKECDKLIDYVGIARWNWSLKECRNWLWRVLLCVKHAHVQVNSKPAWCGCGVCLDKIRRRFCGTGAALYVFELEDWVTVCDGNLRVAQVLRDVLDTIKKRRSQTEKAGIPVKEWSMMLSRAYGLEDVSRGERSMQMGIRKLKREIKWSSYTVATFGDEHWSAEVIETSLIGPDSLDPEPIIVRPCTYAHFNALSCQIPGSTSKNKTT